MEVEVYLAHYGIKGMRWGFRKAPEISTKTARRSISGTAAVAGGVAGAIAGKKALEVGSKFVTSKKTNDFLVNQILKDQNKLVRAAARKHVSKSIAAKANLLVSTLNSSQNRNLIYAGSAVAGAILVGGAALATTHAIQNSRRERREASNT